MATKLQGSLHSKDFALAGIYVHIPFCRKACHYCNFHFSTTLHQKNAVLDALLKEIRLGAGISEIPGSLPLSTQAGQPAIETIYFGGGTPSLLAPHELSSILLEIRRCFPVAEDVECTLEANPDDVNPVNLQAWKAMGINRLSLGIQSFRNEDLNWMNRSHNAEQALRSLDQIAAAGFSNFSADLIYGTPGLSDDAWLEQVLTLTSRQVPHISAYALTVEPRTALDTMIRQGKKENTDADIQARQFSLLMEAMDRSGYEHYEISNFALPGMRSRHNSAYWSGVPYHGFGPSAHSFDGVSRQWNIAHNQAYIRALQEGRIPSEKEDLTAIQQFNEYLMTRLRTAEGLDLDHVRGTWGDEAAEVLSSGASIHIRRGHVALSGNSLVLTREGKLFADGIAADLFRI
jgi:oxygen-independent coproporphyrinogen-3 oxidase